MGPAIAQQPYTGTYTIIQPSVVVVGGCPACRANADLRRGGGDRRGRGGVVVVVVVVCGDNAGVVLDGDSMRDVTVVRWGEHHGCLVCLCVLMVEVDHAFTTLAVHPPISLVRDEQGDDVSLVKAEQCAAIAGSVGEDGAHSRPLHYIVEASGNRHRPGKIVLLAVPVVLKGGRKKDEDED
ncbi:hypothetical protein FQN60_003725 [Etheostoma spectabile]|uniref:Uncharacterized protein n=1 Tax=Etheostoma spectabile TaxID=54343 RepID=A0A5J5D0A6_9PERO|nr:hypothetical protein FQN60_003725 [Etheostoma spectabile]